MADLTGSALELSRALTDEASFLAFLGVRGWGPDPEPIPAPARAALAGARLFKALTHDAPRLLVLFRPDMNDRSARGNELRSLQRDANGYVDLLSQHGAEDRAPRLCLVASPAWLLLFELDGNPFSRRQRYSPDRLGPGTPLETSFRELTAAALAGRSKTASQDDLLASILGTAGRRVWDLSGIVAGSKLDDDFVRYMGHARRRIAQLLLDGKPGRALLKEMWPHLHASVTGEEGAAPSMPKLEVLVLDGRWRRVIIASIDTVLLRLVLYRYLEAQFGYRPKKDESERIAFGSYDDLLKQTTYFDEEKLAKLLKKVGGAEASAALQTQGDLFKPPVTFTDAKRFAQGMKARADHYQASAGGDLHHGYVAEAANLLQDHLLEKHADEFALLLEETSTQKYSFHYADLDPRAFQEFYQSTIGTDIRADLDEATGKVTIGVVDSARGRKEQGAFYTEEKLCSWLVERTLGKTFAEWQRRLLEALGDRKDTGRVAKARALVRELLGWRIIDPTCGGGIFLRGAFEFLSRQREVIAKTIGDKLGATEFAEFVAEAPFSLFGEQDDKNLGDWEWHILLHMLYGVDIDVKAVNVASNLLTLSALSYKRHSLCFPSFINTSLKRGNALVPLLKAEEREAFAKTYQKELKELIALRKRLRKADLHRSEWGEAHKRAAEKTRLLVQSQIMTRFATLFDDVRDPRKLVPRVQKVGVFFYEVEFPEVFFDDDGRVRVDAGFDVVLGNPPWEYPKEEFKQFLPEFDSEYRSLSGPAAAKREKELLAEPYIEERWKQFCASVADQKVMLEWGFYEHQRRKIRGRFPPGNPNLYKYATEMSWKLLKEGARSGLVLDGGLWGDLATSGLRALLLDRSETEAAVGFTNNRGIFDIHRSYKFTATVFRRGGRTETLRAVFMREEPADLDSFDRLAIAIPADDIRTSSRESYPVPEVRDLRHYRGERAFMSHPSLSDTPWEIDCYTRELHALDQRPYFLAPKSGYLPLIQGEQFNHFGVHQGELPEKWVDPSDKGAGGFLRDKQRGRVLTAIADWLDASGKLKAGGKEKAALEWVKAVTGKKDVPSEWVRLDWEGYRLAWRDIARNDDRRTLITGILPPQVAVTHTAPFVRPFRIDVSPSGVTFPLQYPLEQLLYLAGVTSSFAADAIIRSRLAKTHLTSDTFQSLPVPAWTGTRPQVRVAELTARLTCLPADAARPWADYRELAAAVGLTPVKHGLLDPAARREAEVELNALVAELYGLDREDFRFLMDLLFMTPAHRERHEGLRDEIVGRMGGAGVGAAREVGT